MALLDLPKRDSKDSIIKKARTPKKAVATVVSNIEQIRQRVDANLGKYANRYSVIMDEQSLNAYIDKCIEDGVVSIDTETTGLNPILNTIVGVSLKSPSQRAIYIPINHVSAYTKTRIDKQLTESNLKQPLLRLVKKYRHNLA